MKNLLSFILIISIYSCATPGPDHLIPTQEYTPSFDEYIPIEPLVYLDGFAGCTKQELDEILNNQSLLKILPSYSRGWIMYEQIDSSSTRVFGSSTLRSNINYDLWHYFRRYRPESIIVANDTIDVLAGVGARMKIKMESKSSGITLGSIINQNIGVEKFNSSVSGSGEFLIHGILDPVRHTDKTKDFTFNFAGLRAANDVITKYSELTYQKDIILTPHILAVRVRNENETAQELRNKLSKELLSRSNKNKKNNNHTASFK